MKTKKTRVIIRPLRLSDYPLWRKSQDEMLPEQCLFDMGARPVCERTKKHFATLIEKYERERLAVQNIRFGIFVKRTRSLVGIVNLKNIVRGHLHGASIGYWIFNSHWGKGYATESVGLCLDYAFSKLKLHRVQAEIQPANRPSVKVALKAGFRKEGLSKKLLFMKGQWRDYAIYAVTSEDFGYDVIPGE